MSSKTEIERDLRVLNERVTSVLQAMPLAEMSVFHEFLSGVVGTMAAIQSRWSALGDSQSQSLATPADTGTNSEPIELVTFRRHMDRLTSTAQKLWTDASSQKDGERTQAESMADYFSVLTSPHRQVTDAEMGNANIHWEKALERGRNHRDQAIAQIGPVLTPGEVAQRLGVSAVTVKNWRQQSKLLGVKFDDHQYLYPIFQFASTPTEGENGVLRYFANILSALPFDSAWPKAQFFVSQSPALQGRTPITILREISAGAPHLVSSTDKWDDQLEHLRQVARHAGEMGL